MACPARKVITKGEGSALMKEPELAASLVEACVREARVPVTVKIRRGFAAGENTAAEFAARMEQAGAAAVAVHGRTANQLYTGEADWSTIDEVAARVGVPVIGSGDVFSAEDACLLYTSSTAAHDAVRRIRDARHGRHQKRLTLELFTQVDQSLTFKMARNASCGTSTEPMAFMRFLPSFCFSSSLRLREISPP